MVRRLVWKLRTKACPPAHNAPYFTRDFTPDATNSYSQAIVKSLQFESVSMKIVEDAKKMLLCGFWTDCGVSAAARRRIHRTAAAGTGQRAPQ